MINLQQTQNNMINLHYSLFENLPNIPKKIHVSWKSKDINNLKNKFCIVKNGVYKLKYKNPEYQFTIYDDNDINNYLQIHLNDEDFNLIKDRKSLKKQIYGDY